MNQPLPKIQPFSDEWAILRFIKSWTPDNVRCAIDSNVRLYSLLEEHSNGLIIYLIRNAVKNNGDLNSYLSPENVLCWFSVRRPDLHAEIVRTPEGVKWLTSNFEELKQFFNI